MIRIVFLQKKAQLCGFRIQGHAGYAERGQDIVCAAVSSAFYMAANTITEVCGCPALVREEDGRLFVSLTRRDAERCQEILQGLLLHARGLEEQYPSHIHTQLTEV